MSIAIILGTRPEIIKFSPIIRYCIEFKIPYFIIHTGQHYNYEMDRLFFKELEIPDPNYNLNVGSGSHGFQTGTILMRTEDILMKEMPNIILVQGDTNTVMAGALAAVKLNIKIGHIEAGLRSNDRKMPEEINRIIADHISDYLYAPTENSAFNLIQEGIDRTKIFITGNTVVDAVFQNLEITKDKEDTLKNYGLQEGQYVVTTIHRAENVDDPRKLFSILSGLKEIAQRYSLKILFPVHPRTRKMINIHQIEVDKITLIDPVGYFDFLQLEANAKAILTDSGGVQEEACILHVPCVTLRENTERPETLEVGANILAGTDPANIVSSFEQILKKSLDWENPYGDGRSGERIIKLLIREGII